MNPRNDQLPFDLLTQLVAHCLHADVISWVRLPHKPESFILSYIFTTAQVVFTTARFNYMISFILNTSTNNTDNNGIIYYDKSEIQIDQGNSFYYKIIGPDFVVLVTDQHAEANCPCDQLFIEYILLCSSSHVKDEVIFIRSIMRVEPSSFSCVQRRTAVQCYDVTIVLQVSTKIKNI